MKIGGTLCITHPKPLANDLVTREPEARRGETKLDKQKRGTANPDAGQGYTEEDICGRSDLAPT